MIMEKVNATKVVGEDVDVGGNMFSVLTCKEKTMYSLAQRMLGQSGSLASTEVWVGH